MLYVNYCFVFSVYLCCVNILSVWTNGQNREKSLKCDNVGVWQLTLSKRRTLNNSIYFRMCLNGVLQKYTQRQNLTSAWCSEILMMSAHCVRGWRTDRGKFSRSRWKRNPRPLMPTCDVFKTHSITWPLWRFSSEQGWNITVLHMLIISSSSLAFACVMNTSVWFWV